MISVAMEKEGCEMIKILGSNTEKKKCVVCQHKTGDYVEYGYQDGVSIQIPICECCKDKVGLFLREPMKAALSIIQCSVTASRFITEDEKTIRELRSKKVGESDA
jgi:hypothetical protein